MQRLALDPVVGLGHGLKEGLLVGSWLGQTGASQQLHARILYMAFYTNLEAWIMRVLQYLPLDI